MYVCIMYVLCISLCIYLCMYVLIKLCIRSCSSISNVTCCQVSFVTTAAAAAAAAADDDDDMRGDDVLTKLVKTPQMILTWLVGK